MEQRRLESNAEWKKFMENMAEQISPGPLEANQCSMCWKNDKENEYWIMWKDVEGQEYVCTECKDSFCKWARGADAVAWVHAVANHDHEESQNLWDQMHDFLKDNVGVDVNEEHAEHVVRHAQEASSHCCQA